MYLIYLVMYFLAAGMRPSFLTQCFSNAFFGLHVVHRFTNITAQYSNYNKMKQRHVKKWTDHSKLIMTMYWGRTQKSLYLYWDPKFLFSYSNLWKKSVVGISKLRTYPILTLESIWSTQCHTLFWAFQKTKICDLLKNKF